MCQLTHPLPPHWDSRSRVLILGTFPSPQSRAQGFFYMHPQNRFWPILAALFGAETPMGADARAAFAREKRIALWDVLAACEITGAADLSIKHPVPNDLTPILQGADIRSIFTTGKKALALYNQHILPTSGRAAIGLPSTSSANRAVSWGVMTAAYQQILQDLN